MVLAEARSTVLCTPERNEKQMVDAIGASAAGLLVVAMLAVVWRLACRRRRCHWPKADRG